MCFLLNMGAGDPQLTQQAPGCPQLLVYSMVNLCGVFPWSRCANACCSSISKSWSSYVAAASNCYFCRFDGGCFLLFAASLIGTSFVVAHLLYQQMLNSCWRKLEIYIFDGKWICANELKPHPSRVEWSISLQPVQAGWGGGVGTMPLFPIVRVVNSQLSVPKRVCLSQAVIVWEHVDGVKLTFAQFVQSLILIVSNRFETTSDALDSCCFFFNMELCWVQLEVCLLF